MWIAFRLLVALIAYAVRVSWRSSAPIADGSLAGVAYYKRLDTTKAGNVYAFRIGVQFKAPLTLALHPETWWDRLFKRLGLATEVQTGSSAFDERVYVACDNARFLQFLRTDKAAREAILRVIDAGFRRVFTDGQALWLERKADREPLPEEQPLLTALRLALAPALERLKGSVDPFVVRAAAAEAVSWGIAGYAIASVLERELNPEDIHMDPASLVAPGLLLGAAVFAVLLALIVLSLRGSSRGHRIVLESGLLLLAGCSGGGIQLLADLNRTLDRSPSVVIVAPIEDRRVQRSRRTTSYWLYIRPPADSEVRVPHRIHVSSGLYHRASLRDVAKLHIGRGWLGYPWYRRIEITPAQNP